MAIAEGLPILALPDMFLLLTAVAFIPTKIVITAMIMDVIAFLADLLVRALEVTAVFLWRGRIAVNLMMFVIIIYAVLHLKKI